MMKKIILIDDNSKNQRVAYGASYVDEGIFSDILVHVEKLNSQSDLSFLNEASCVMMHDSLEDYVNDEFVSSSHKAKERIEDMIQEMKIPYVLFSDGHAPTAEWREETPTIVYSIKKSEFYRHFKDFIESYQTTGKLDMRIIAYGKDYLKELICKWCQTLIANVTNFEGDKILDLASMDKKSLRLVIENTQPKIGISFDDLMCDIEDECVTVSQFRTNINNVISSVKKYGKNISSWK